jgi:hypothetical protein
MRKYWILGSLLVVIALFVGGFVLVGDQTRSSDPKGVIPVAATKPVELIGNWTQTNGTPSLSMTATITDGKIVIDMHLANDEGGTYWIGSFDTGKHTSSNFTVTSAGDVAKMSTMLLASQAMTKTFTYDNGVLSFDFSMMGVTRTVHLQRSSE